MRRVERDEGLAPLKIAAPAKDAGGADARERGGPLGERGRYQKDKS
jgi:hypothetical protein